MNKANAVWTAAAVLLAGLLSVSTVVVHTQAPPGPRATQVVQSDFTFIVRDDGSVVGCRIEPYAG